jgi:glycosyltransferase involved in cell wall biosynthesis
MNPGRMILYAPGIHIGGGLVLLRYLLESMGQEKNIILYYDIRCEIKEFSKYKNLTIVPIGRSYISRLFAEFSLMKARNMDTVLCFHSLPPIFPIKAKCFVYCQNVFIVNQDRLDIFSLKVKAKLIIERFIFKYALKKNIFYIAQTQTMQNLIKRIKKNADIKILGFSKTVKNGKKNLKNKWDFIYIASDLPHKNHIKLVEAWEILAKENIYPKLLLITNLTNEKLKDSLCKYRGRGFSNIYVLKNQPHEKMLTELLRSKALIFPSLAESFGLPLVEAQNFDKPILASELDFVRDVCSPVDTFDPNSSLSIARAVKRFLGYSDVKDENLNSNLSKLIKLLNEE